MIRGLSPSFLEWKLNFGRRRLAGAAEHQLSRRLTSAWSGTLLGLDLA